jgi:hypothetical protein
MEDVKNHKSKYSIMNKKVSSNTLLWNRIITSTERVENQAYFELSPKNELGSSFERQNSLNNKLNYKNLILDLGGN